MPVNISGGGGGLAFDATIEDSQFSAKIQKMEAGLEGIRKTANLSSKEQQKALDALLGKYGAQNRSIESLKIQHQSYSRIVEKSTDPARLVKYNAKLQEIEAEINRLKNVGKVGFDSLGNAIESNTSKTKGFLAGLRNIAATLGVVFGINEVVQFGKELFNVAVATSGIDRAFSRLGNSQDLVRLREETQGFVSDLQLEKLTVKANNFNIPISKLGGFLLFAQQRAKETGESVDKLTDNIIDGLGRKSSRIIDNLGISIVDIQKEFSKTGDFTLAVSNIIQRETENAGGAVDTLADRTGRIATAWDNAKKSVSSFFARLLNPDVADSGRIGEITKQQNKALGLVRKNETETTEFQKKTAEQRAKIIEDQYRKVLALDNKRKAVDSQYSGMFADKSKFVIDDEKRAAAEQLAAAQNVLRVLKDQNIEREKIERTAKNILSIAEMEEKVAGLRTKADNIIVGVSGTAKERDALYKEAQKTQDLVDKLKGKNYKKDLQVYESLIAKKAKLDAQALKGKADLELKILDVDAEYSRKSFNADEEELQAIRDRFKRISDEVAKFNSDPKNKLFQVDASGLNKTRDAAISDLTYKQETERLKISLEEQKALYAEFEDYQSTVGLQKAKEHFKSRINVEKTYLKQLEAEREKIANVDDGSLTAGQLARLESLNKLIDAEKAIREKAYLQTFASTLSLEEKIDKARREYLKRYDELIQGSSTKTLTPEQIKALQVARDASIDAAKDEAFQTTEIYKELNRDITYYTQEQLKIKIKSLQGFLDSAKNLPEELKNSLSFELNTAKSKLGSSSDDNYIQELENRKKVIQQALKGEKLSTQEYQKQLKALEDINNEINKVKDGKFDKDLSTLKAIGGFADELSSAFEGVNDEISEALSGISQIAAVGGNAIGAGKSFLSGDILGGITQSISAIGGIIKLIGGDRAAQRRETAAYFAQVFEGELEYARMMRARQSIQENITSLTIRELEARKDMLSGQSTSAQDDFDKILSQIRDAGNAAQRAREEAGKSFGALRSNVRRDIENSMLLTDADYKELERLFTTGQMTDKVKALFSQLREAKKEMEGLADAGKETDEVLSKIRTGTTAQDLATSLSDMFKSGKTGVEDFADFFENTMKNAIFSTFEANVLNKLMEDFYKTFDERAKDGIDATDIAALQKKFNEDVVQAGTAQLDALKQATGLDFSSDKDKSGSNSLRGSIQASLTEDTGTILAGTFRGVQLNTVELVNIGRQQLEINMRCQDIAFQTLNTALKTEANTFRTANNTERLAAIETALISIDKKMSNPSNALAAGGVKP